MFFRAGIQDRIPLAFYTPSGILSIYMMISVAEAATDLRISPRRVRQLIEAGRLAAKIVGGTYIIDSRALEAVRIRTVGKPKKIIEKSAIAP
jgi:excisionase family DNA binding protein